MKVVVTENQTAEDNLLYLQTMLSELFTNSDCNARLDSVFGRSKLTINCPDYYGDIIKTEVCDRVAEVITIKYKSEFFNSNLKVGGLSVNEKDILYASLIAADLDDDKKYTFDRLKNYSEIAIDGVYNFRLKLLKKKWWDVIDCIPPCFLTSQLKEFISYLIENKRKRVYIDNGRVYDNHYRRLNRCALLGGQGVKIIREVLLSNCGEVNITGDIPKEDEFYLKEFYTDKISFKSDIN